MIGDGTNPPGSGVGGDGDALTALNAAVGTLAIGEVAAVDIAPPGKGTDLWKKALQQLPPEIRSEVDLYQGHRLELLHDVLQCTEEKKKFCIDKRWKWKRRDGTLIILRDVFEKMMTWVKSLMSVLDFAVKQDPTGYSVLPWAIIKTILQLSINDVQLFGDMAVGVERVSQLITRYEIIERLYLQGKFSATEDGLENEITKLYTRVLEFLTEALAFYQRSTVRRVAGEILTAGRSPVQDSLEKVVKVQTEVDFYLRLVEAEYRDTMTTVLENTSSDVQAIQDHLKEMLEALDKPIMRITSQLSDLHDALEESQRLKVIDWVSSLSYMSRHLASVKRLMSNSGQWLLTHETFLEWRKQSSSSLLWLHGIPGSGKTMLLSAVIEHLLEETEGHHPIAYFYCDARNTAEPETQDPTEILRSIVSQLSLVDESRPIRQPVIDAFNRKKTQSRGMKPERLDLDESVEVILKLLESNPAIIILDALDECDPSERYRLIDALDKIKSESSSLVQILVSSRDDGDLKAWLQESANILIQSDDTKKDIETYVDEEVDQAIAKRRLLKGNVTIELRRQIKKELASRAQGMFRWVALQLENLCNPRRIKTSDDLLSELKRLPDTLKESYNIIFRNISESGPTSYEMAIHTMQWLLYAKDELKTQEMIAAVSLNWDNGYSQVSEEDLLDFCCNLIVQNPVTDSLEFAHMSVREYIVKRDEFSKVKGHTTVVERCLYDYIYDVAKSPFPVVIKKQIKILKHYAWNHLGTHLQNIDMGIIEEGTKRRLERFLFEDHVAFRSWSKKGQDRDFRQKGRVYYFREEDSSDGDDLNSSENSFLRSGTTPDAMLPALHRRTKYWSTADRLIFLSCRYNLLFVLEKVVSGSNRGQDADLVNFIAFGRTPLSVAASFGYLEVIKFLIQSGADPNLCGIDSPLYLAARGGYIEVVKYLVDGGASLDHRNKDGQCPLHIASMNGHIKVVRYLVDCSASLNQRNSAGWCPLYIAAGEGHTEVVKYLGDHGADLENLNNFGESPLHVAAENGHIEVVQYLGDHGANLNYRNTWGRSPLTVATDNNNVEVVKYLIDHNANTECRDRFGETPLYVAADHGNIKVVEYLVSHGANLECRNKEGKTALQTLLLKANNELVKYLVQHGADLSNRNREGMTPLHLAVQTREPSNVELLVKHGADVESVDNKGFTPLCWAAYASAVEEAQILIDHGARVNNGGPRGWTPLHAAISARRTKFMKFLLEQHCADVNIVDGEGKSPLFLAVYFRSPKTIRYLVEHGADLQRRDRYDRSLMHFATGGGKINNVRFLLNPGSFGVEGKDGLDIDARDRDGSTPLHYAVEYAKVAMVELLANRDVGTGQVKTKMKDIARHGDGRVPGEMLNWSKTKRKIMDEEDKDEDDDVRERLQRNIRIAWFLGVDVPVGMEEYVNSLSADDPNFDSWRYRWREREEDSDDDDDEDEVELKLKVEMVRVREAVESYTQD